MVDWLMFGALLMVGALGQFVIVQCFLGIE